MPERATRTVPVTTTTLEQRSPADVVPGRPLPEGARIDLVEEATPEFVRWLYATVGGPWRWCDRLAWPRERWAQELARPGSEVRVAFLGGAPAGYVQLGAEVHDDGTHVEIRYFGLQDWAIGRGLGGALLTHGIERAWDLPGRHGLPAASRVWLHTCTLDGPAALPNYRARGFRVVAQETKDQEELVEPLGPWVAAGGPGAPAGS